MPNIQWMSFFLGIAAVYVFHYITAMMSSKMGS